MTDAEKEAQARKEGKTIVRVSPGSSVEGPNVVQITVK